MGVRLLCIFAWFAGFGIYPLSAQHNQLTADEKKQGWQLLFDGKTPRHWRAAYQKDFPKQGWVVRDGMLLGELAAGGESTDAGDIVTRETYQNFEFRFDWKLGKGGNSGVKYFVEERTPKPEGSVIGCEYQLIDDENYIYQGKHLPDKLKTAGLYDVYPATNKPAVAMDEWHQSRIVVNGSHVEHWLDGVKVLDYKRHTPEFRQAVAQSKFKDYAGFGETTKGHILLQDHGHTVAFRNLKIRILK